MTTKALILTAGIFVFQLGVFQLGSAQAQSVLMNSAETINKGNFKIAVFPTLLLGEDDAENEWGVATRLGYGFTDSFDVEGKFSFFEGLRYYGVDAEVWLLKGRNDVSVALGAHKTDFEGDFDVTGIDASVLASRNVSPTLELYGGLNLSFESIDNVDDASYTRAHLVPGVEYKLSRDLDLLAEVGLGLNDDSPNYVSVGLALYLR